MQRLYVGANADHCWGEAFAGGVIPFAKPMRHMLRPYRIAN